MEYVLQVCQFVLTIIEIGMCYAFCDLLIEKNRKSKLSMIIKILMVLGLSVITLLTRWMGGFINHLFYIIYGLLMAIPICKLNKVKYGNVLGVTMLYHSAVGILYVMMLFILKLLIKDDIKFVNEIYLEHNNLRLVVMVSALVFVVVIYFMMKSKSDYKVILAQRIKRLLLVYGIFGWWFIAWGLIGIMSISYIYAVWYIVTYICIIIIVWASIGSFANGFEKELEMNAVQLRVQLMDRYYKEVQLLTENCMYTTHDMKNHILLLENYAENNDLIKIKNYLKQIGAPMNEIDQYVWCNNEVVNLIINTKLGETKKRNIKVKTDFDNVLFPMTDNELCSVLANLLDNAVDACEKVKESERWITISIKDCSTYILIKIENSIADYPEKKKNEFVSKKHGCHGYGLKSVKVIVDKYHGEMKFDYDERSFSVIVVIEKGEKDNE